MTKPILVTIEHTPKKSFATAADWPGWSRSGKTEELALEALVVYGARYAVIADAEHRRFAASVTVADLEVVERHAGSGGTEFGVPSRPTDHDARPTDADDAARLAGLVEAAWRYVDRVAAAAPEELRKGPRGGGRNTSKVVAHVMDADRAYAREIGLKVKESPRTIAPRSRRCARPCSTRSGPPATVRPWPDATGRPATPPTGSRGTPSTMPGRSRTAATRVRRPRPRRRTAPRAGRGSDRAAPARARRQRGA